MLINNGYASVNSVTNSSAILDSFYQNSRVGINPYFTYLHLQAQENGVFGLDFSQHEIAPGKFHLFKNNFFSHNFCIQGCAFDVQGDKA